MTITAKFYGQDCTVVEVTTYASEPVYIVTALPGAKFPNGSHMFSTFDSAGIVKTEVTQCTQ